MVGSLASKFVNKKIFPGTNHEVDSILYIYIYIYILWEGQN